jgi:hypothetical protein
MGWTVHVNVGDDVGAERQQAELSEKFSFREEAEAFAAKQRELDPEAEVYVVEDPGI